MYYYERPNHQEWSDRSVPPPPSSIHEEIFDCSDVKDVHGITVNMPTHGGYHYSSTAVEWYHLIDAIRHFRATSQWIPQVSLTDGIRAVELGIAATDALSDSASIFTGTATVETKHAMGTQEERVGEVSTPVHGE